MRPEKYSAAGSLTYLDILNSPQHSFRSEVSHEDSGKQGNLLFDGNSI